MKDSGHSVVGARNSEGQYFQPVLTLQSVSKTFGIDAH
jgi:hypothetical protein